MAEKKREPSLYDFVVDGDAETIQLVVKPYPSRPTGFARTISVFASDSSSDAVDRKSTRLNSSHRL